ncbi:MAG: hypothetical protein Q4F17_11285 [Eubacteriales bacterium]|nr:hypothetical protein [Eubacteriales bacterium]
MKNGKHCHSAAQNDSASIIVLIGLAQLVIASRVAFSVWQSVFPYFPMENMGGGLRSGRPTVAAE